MYLKVLFTVDAIEQEKPKTFKTKRKDLMSRLFSF